MAQDDLSNERGMTEPKKVKIEIELPEEYYEYLKAEAQFFKKDLKEYLAEMIISDVESSVNDHPQQDELREIYGLPKSTI